MMPVCGLCGCLRSESQASSERLCPACRSRSTLENEHRQVATTHLERRLRDLQQTLDRHSGLIDVDAFTTLVVRTDNSVYRITILTPHLREVLVQGDTFFPERTRACLNGSSFGGSCLKIGWVGLGLHLEFHAGGQWIITSHVRAIAVEASPTGDRASRSRQDA